MPNGSPRVRDRYERCTEFTTDHGLASVTAEDDVFGAAVCPECENKNPLKGLAHEFKEQSFRCMRCTRVMVLDGSSLDDFEAEVLNDE